MKTESACCQGLGVKLVILASATVGLVGHSAWADTAVAWGQNNVGELGNGTYSPSYPFGNQSSPGLVLNLSNGVTTVNAGTTSSFAIQNGSLYAWGSDQYGQLGIASYYAYPSRSLLPVAVPSLASGVTAIAAGDFHTLAIRNGAAYAWGDNSYGELGDGSTTLGLTPSPVSNLSGAVTSIAAGRYYSLAVQNGAVYAWGANWHGQLGNGTTTNSNVPVPVTGLSNGVSAIATTGLDEPGTNSTGGLDGTIFSHSLAIRNGGVYAWGYNAEGELGNGTNVSSLVPVAVANLSTGVTSIATGLQDSLAVKDGNVYTWGDNTYGELGDGTTVAKMTPELIDPGDLSNIMSVAASADSSFALAADGSLWVWGGNAEGGLGLGSGANYLYLSPQHLLAPTGFRFTSISGQGDGGATLATIAPIPEPTSVSLLAVITLGLVRRRFGRSNR